MKTPKERNCKECGMPFLSIRWNKKFCSKECHLKSWKVWKREIWDPKYRSENKEMFEKATKRWHQSPRGKASAIESRNRMRNKYPDKSKARAILEYAVRSKRIIKPEICTDCKKITKGRKLQGHHHDYDKPLEVKWLCSMCHSKHHYENK